MLQLKIALVSLLVSYLFGKLILGQILVCYSLLPLTLELRRFREKKTSNLIAYNVLKVVEKFSVGLDKT